MYEHLIGKEATLEVTLGDVIVPVRGIILEESEKTLQFRVAPGWDVDVYKAMISRVVEET
jgi:hypothetical protein